MVSLVNKTKINQFPCFKNDQNNDILINSDKCNDNNGKSKETCLENLKDKYNNNTDNSTNLLQSNKKIEINKDLNNDNLNKSKKKKNNKKIISNENKNLEYFHCNKSDSLELKTINIRLIITNNEKINCEGFRQKIMNKVMQIFGIIEASKLVLEIKLESIPNIFQIVTNNLKVVSTSIILLEDHIKPNIIYI